MKNTALIVGSFDPFTFGHFYVVEKALSMFPKVIIAVAKNAQKQSFFTVEERIEIISKTLQMIKDEDARRCIQICAYEDTMAVDIANETNAHVLVRGVRNVADMVYELNMANANSALNPFVQTVLIPCDPAISHISSSLVRDMYRCGNTDQIGQIAHESVVNLLKRQEGAPPTVA